MAKAGTYSGMKIDGKSLTIQAEAGAFVDIASPTMPILLPSCSEAGTSICNLGSPQSVRLRGLTISANGEGLLLDVNAGLVWIEECSIRCAAVTRGVFFACQGTGAGVWARNCSDIVLVRSQLAGSAAACCDLLANCPGCTSTNPESGSGLFAQSSDVHAFGCTFTGAPGIGKTGSFECEPQKGGYGVRGAGTPAPFLFLSDCTLVPGDGLGCALDESLGCNHNIGGDGLFWAGMAAVLDSSIQAGTAVPRPGDGCDNDCPPLTDGVPITPHPDLVLDELPGQALRMRVSSPVRENNSFDVDIEWTPNTPIWFQVSLLPNAVFMPLSRGTLLVGANPLILFLGVTDSSGRLSSSIPLGPLPPGVEGRVFFTQALGGSVSVLAGKLSQFPRPRRILGEGSMLLELDESF